MKKINTNCLTALVLVSNLISCSGPQAEKVSTPAIKIFPEIEKVNWLVGSWHNTSPEVSSTEIWEKKNDSTLAGTSFVIVGKDTVSYETICLEQNGTALFYIPTVKEQNGAQAIKFTLTSLTTNKMIFENPKHDFPTKITYNKISNDSMSAEISGMIEGKEKKEQFPFVRMK